MSFYSKSRQTPSSLKALLTICLISVGLSACAAKEALIPGKQAPDEFAIYTQAPLSIPPEYTLRVPEPGADRPQEQNPELDAQQVVLGNVTNKKSNNELIEGSSGMQVLLRNTGALDVDPNIRELVNQETSVLAEESGTVMDMIMFWGEDTAYGIEVDPALENKRIQESQALGQPLYTGETPTIVKENKSVIDSLF